MKLTQSLVDRALYEGESYMSKSGRKRWRDQIHWDDELPGFGLKITKTNYKTFIVNYRAKGRTRRKSLGRTSQLTLAEAREKATALLAEEPPAAPAPPPRVDDIGTVGELATAYLEGYLKLHTPSWFAEQRLIRKHINPAMGRTALAEVSSMDLTSLRARVARKFPADGRRLASLLRGMFDWAAERGLWSPGSKPAARGAAAKAGGAGKRRAKATAPATEVERLTAALEESENRRRELAARLEEVSESSSGMMTELNELAAERKRLESRLERSEGKLRRARDEPDKSQPTGETAKTLANLKQSVQQLMDSLAASESARRELTTRLERVEGHDQGLAERMTGLVRERDELEKRLRKAQRLAAGGNVDSDRGRLLAWLAAGAGGGLALGFVLARLLW